MYGSGWEVLGFSGPGCNLPTTDGAKLYTNSEECESGCLADPGETMSKDGAGFPIPDHILIDALNSSRSELTGTCSQWVGNFGCLVWVEKGRYVVICVD